MGLIKKLGLTIVGAALKAYDPERFRKIIEKGDKVYAIAVDLAQNGDITPFTKKTFSNEKDAEQWVEKTRSDTCKKYSGGGKTIFPTIEKYGTTWRAAVWVVDDEEILRLYDETNEISLPLPREGAWLETERYREGLSNTWETIEIYEASSTCTLTFEVNKLSCFYDESLRGTFFVMRMLNSSPDQIGVNDYFGCFLSDDDLEKAEMLVERIEHDDGSTIEEDTWWDFGDRPYELDDDLSGKFTEIRSYGVFNSYSNPPLFVFHIHRVLSILRSNPGMTTPLRSS